ncbi:MAG: hypothetical protein K9N10_10910 [Deltaproteobacteria bacterium]|nr:hypothetical protein [Deltaproteobacteria bacterium]
MVLEHRAKPSPELETEIKGFVKVRLAAHEYPREIEFVSELPMTNTGKIIRRELKARGSSEKRGHPCKRTPRFEIVSQKVV